MDGMKKIKAIIKEQEQKELIAFMDATVSHSKKARNGNPESVAWVSKLLQAGVDNVEVWDGIPRCVLLVAVEHYLNGVPPTANENNSISGQTHGRLQRAIAAFPERYPEYQSKPPKLDDDVRPWLKESELGENEAERRVFGAIIREHFKLSPDTPKSQ